MKKITSIVLCVAMLLCIAPTSVFAQESANIPEMETSTSENQIVTRANPTNLYYTENSHAYMGFWSTQSVTPTKGRSLRTWILVKEGTVRMSVVHNGRVVFSKDYSSSAGDKDDLIVSSCDGGTYEFRFKCISSDNQAYSNISVLIYETGG